MGAFRKPFHPKTKNRRPKRAAVTTVIQLLNIPVTNGVCKDISLFITAVFIRNKYSI